MSWLCKQCETINTDDIIECEVCGAVSPYLYYYQKALQFKKETRHEFNKANLDYLPAALAPVKLCVMPLVKKDGLPEKAREIINNLKFHFNCQYDEKDSIGKRYRRQDAIGTPYCVTVDHDTLKDNTVTLRFRDTMEQERVSIDELNGIIEDKVSIASLLKKIQ